MLIESDYFFFGSSREISELIIYEGNMASDYLFLDFL